MSPGEALENGVRPLVEGGELKRLEGADGQTGKRNRHKGGRIGVKGRLGGGGSVRESGKALDKNMKMD